MPKSPTWLAFQREDGTYAPGPFGGPTLVANDDTVAESLAEPGEHLVEVRITPVRRVLQAKRKRA